MPLKKISIGRIVDATQKDLRHKINMAQHRYDAIGTNDLLTKWLNMQNRLHNFNGILQNTPDGFWINIIDAKLAPQEQRQAMRDEFKNKVRRNFIRHIAPQMMPAFIAAGIPEDALEWFKKGAIPPHHDGEKYDITVSHRQSFKHGGDNTYKNLLFTADHIDFLTDIFDIAQLDSKETGYKLSLIYKDEKAKMLIGSEGFRQRSPLENKARASKYIGFELR